MGLLFSHYALIRQSGLFDDAYYCRENPEVRQRNLDPLVHYLETGASELRNPSADFNAREYFQSCQDRGVKVENPLLHYLESRLQVAAAPPSATPLTGSRGSNDGLLVNVEHVEVVNEKGIKRLFGVGWCLADPPLSELLIQVGAVPARTHYGLERADVADKYPGLINADRSGFEFEICLSSERFAPSLQFDFTAKSAGCEPRSVAVRVKLEGGGAEPRVRTSPGVQGSGVRKVNGRALRQRAAPLSAILLNIDQPAEPHSAQSPVHGDLEIRGWALSRSGLSLIEIAVDGQAVKSADTGLYRQDVQRAHPHWNDSERSGFAALIPKRSLTSGAHIVRVTARGHSGESASKEFRIKVDEVSDQQGPWSVRRKMSPAEIAFCKAPIAGPESRHQVRCDHGVPDDNESGRRAANHPQIVGWTGPCAVAPVDCAAACEGQDIRQAGFSRIPGTGKPS